MRKRALLIVGLALMIAAAGVVYAHWTATLKVDAEVKTGFVSMQWQSVFTDDDGVANATYDDEPVTGSYTYGSATSSDPDGSGPMALRNGKDVADCIASISPDGSTLILRVNNAYPSYNCTMWSTHQNLGSVPLKAQEIRHWLYKGTTPITSFVPEGTWATLQGHSCGQQIDPGEQYQTINTFHIEQAASQNATYTVYQEIKFVNWNEWDEADCKVFMHDVLVGPWG